MTTIDRKPIWAEPSGYECLGIYAVVLDHGRYCLDHALDPTNEKVVYLVGHNHNSYYATDGNNVWACSALYSAPTIVNGRGVRIVDGHGRQKGDLDAIINCAKEWARGNEDK